MDDLRFLGLVDEAEKIGNGRQVLRSWNSELPAGPLAGWRRPVVDRSVMFQNRRSIVFGIETDAEEGSFL